MRFVVEDSWQSEGQVGWRYVRVRDTKTGAAENVLKHDAAPLSLTEYSDIAAAVLQEAEDEINRAYAQFVDMKAATSD